MNGIGNHILYRSSLLSITMYILLHVLFTVFCKVLGLKQDLGLINGTKWKLKDGYTA